MNTAHVTRVPTRPAQAGPMQAGPMQAGPMQAGPMQAGPIQAGEVQASLAQAPDATLARVVAMVDALPDRGEADAIIAPLRPRLAQLRPVRPVGFSRLLFTPLNPVILTKAEWRRADMGLPRPSLTALGKAVRTALGNDSIWCTEGQVSPERGPALWTQAALVLDRLQLPTGWRSETGLTDADYNDVRGVAAAILHEAAQIEWLTGQQDLVDDAAIRGILTRSQARVRAALDTAVAVLLTRLASPVRILAIAAEVTGSDHVVGRALDRLVSQFEQRPCDITEMRPAAYEAARIAVLLASFEGATPQSRRSRLDTVRRRADASCRICFEQAFTQTMLVLKAGSEAPPDDESVATMEAQIRDLRWLETAARKLGSAKFYDTMLTEAVATVRSNRGRLALADQVRMVEILAGPEQALALLSSGGGTRAR